MSLGSYNARPGKTICFEEQRDLKKNPSDCLLQQMSLPVRKMKGHLYFVHSHSDLKSILHLPKLE